VDLALTDSVVIVTGASRGIGRDIACAFVQEGARVAAVARDREGLLETVRVSALSGGSGTLGTWVCDLRDAKQVGETVGGIVDALGVPEILVNNAGSRQDFARLGDLATTAWDASFAENLTTAFQMTQAVLPGMLRQGRGSIVNIGSVAGTKGGNISGRT
jgi:NAD(P)-dependent dehydrogenase (short-subunit alcohol dehydrogenase family)